VEISAEFGGTTERRLPVDKAKGTDERTERMRPACPAIRIEGALGALEDVSGALTMDEWEESGGGPEIMTVEDDADTTASTICEPDSPTLSVNPSEVPPCVEERTLYSAELAIHEGTSCVTTELYPFRGVYVGLPWEASKSIMRSSGLEVVTVFEWEVPEKPPVAFGRLGLVSKGEAVFAPQTPSPVRVYAVG
jgi:hypothetical protein